MVYRKMEKLGEEVSLLGFGCMRFPLTKEGQIDEERSEKMIDRAMEAGINYYDTAHVYHAGKSEPFVGKALKKYDRSQFYLATKLSSWTLNTTEDVEAVFQEQLELLQTDYIDFYLLHCLNKTIWQKIHDLGALDIVKRLKSEGKIRHLGFSFHDDYEMFETIIKAEPWDFCQIQLNYMDTEIQAGLKGYDLAEKLGIPVIIMEPLKGGFLTSFAEDIQDKMKQAAKNRSVASWAMRYIGALPNVKVVLSGMSTEEQLEDNLATFEQFEPLNTEEQKVLEQVVKDIKSRQRNGCTDCKYCMPCENGVNIPKNFAVWNEYAMYLNQNATKNAYFNEIKEENRASACVSCGACEEVCPQKIPIREHLKQVQEELNALKK